MSIRLIAFDLDGTLLKEDKTVSGRTMAALQNAADRGIYLCPPQAEFTTACRMW